MRCALGRWGGPLAVGVRVAVATALRPCPQEIPKGAENLKVGARRGGDRAR